MAEKLDVDSIMMGITTLRMEVDTLKQLKHDASDPTGAWKKGTEFMANSVEMLARLIVMLEHENEQLTAEVRRLGGG